jgi:hypothetical protein
MSDVILVNLELLTPLKYDKVIFQAGKALGNIYDVVDVYEDVYSFRNLKNKNRTEKSDVKRAKDALILGSEAIRALGGCNKAPKKVEFRGLHKLERDGLCYFHYAVTNYNEEIKQLIKVCDPYNMIVVKTLVITTGLDDKTIGTFKDMFDEL